MFAPLIGKSVIVTGGSKGIGKGIARVFAGHGANSGAAHFAVCDAEGLVVGVMSLEDIGAETRRAMLGYWIGAPGDGPGAR